MGASGFCQEDDLADDEQIYQVGWVDAKREVRWWGAG